MEIIYQHPYLTTLWIFMICVTAINLKHGGNEDD